MARILVIEDDPTILENVIELLNLEGYDTLSAIDGAIGIEKATQHLPELILCDIRMPQANGYEVLEALRANPQTSTIPFIFMTAKTNGADIQRLSELDAVDYLSKPFEINTLLDLIQKKLAS